MRLGQTGEDTIACFDPDRNEIVVNEGLGDASLNILIQHLAHEGTHVQWNRLNSIDQEYHLKSECKQTPIRERRIFLEESNQLYQLDYTAPEEDYETWLEAFHTLVESFAFPEKPTDMVSYLPVVTAAPQPLREESPEYEAERDKGNE